MKEYKFEVKERTFIVYDFTYKEALIKFASYVMSIGYKVIDIRFIEIIQ